MYDSISALEQAAAPVWTMIDDFTTLFAEYENSHDDVASRLEAMRRSYASSLQLLLMLQPIERTIEHFAQRCRRFEDYISRTALNYGLNLLPDDVLSEIFVIAAATLEEKVTLSLVCRRFRSVMMSMRRMWDGYWIESTQSPEQIIAIAEGHGFVSLKARICDSCNLPLDVKARVAKRGPDLQGYRMRYYKFSVELIMSFNLEELEFGCLIDRDWEEIEPILGSANVQNLRGLKMGEDSRNSTTILLLERWRIPHLQDLDVHFVPGAALARSIVRCSLDDIAEADFDSLREFLAAAKSIQELRLFLEGRFYEVCDLPSLRSLVVNFVPHPTLARHLIRFRLSGIPTYQRHSLSGMLDFLSSSEALQGLAIDSYFGERSAVDTSPVVTMPSVLSCDVQSYRMGPTLIANLRMPALRTIRVCPGELEGMSMTTRNEFRTSLRSMSSLQELELYGGVEIAELDEIVRYAPPHLESFSLKGCNCFATGSERWNTSPAPPRKLVHLNDCTFFGWEFVREFVPIFVDLLKAVGLDGVQLQFSECKGWRNGTFRLDDVVSARVNS